mmetsp:Transcript_77412/g.173522  ORF Transcript_77412/g.173522 Transcript_77412/m.173522 type:complete len:269 (+) Transcript_77412:2-808(+)
MTRSEEACASLPGSAGLRRLRGAASRLQVLATAKNLFNFGVHVDYEPLKALKVAGIDVHLELNRFIGAWLNGLTPEELGQALADFFEDFKEEEEPEEKEQVADAEVRSPTAAMLREAMLVAQQGEEPELPASCFTDAAADIFVQDVNAAIDHMLQKRKRSMQQGLKELVDSTDRVLNAAPAECVRSTGAKTIWRAAKKVGRLTRKTVVDYGTYIKYEAMKSLTVGSVAVHGELNSFLAAWKLRSQEEAGAPFGELMVKFSSIKGHDEL